MSAGHSHGPTAHLVDGCPLCDAAKAARNQAIHHLSEALHLFTGLRPEGQQPTIRLTLAPINPTNDDTSLCHNFDLTPKQMEYLAEQVDTGCAYTLFDCAGLNVVSPDAVFATEHPVTAALIADAFDEMDLTAISTEVLDNTPAAERLAVNRLLDDWFGDIVDPELIELYGDEDGNA